MNNFENAVLGKINELKQDRYNFDRAIRSAESEQAGTSIPMHYMAGDTLTVNPSAISTSMIARMIDTDETILSAVEFKILMLLTKVGDYQHSNPAIQDFVQNFLKRLRRPSWIETMESMASAFGFGFSVSEVVYGLNKDMQKVPTRIPTYHPSTIAFETDRSGQITDDGILQFVLDNTVMYGNPNERMSKIRKDSRITNPFTTPVDHTLPRRMPFFSNYGIVRIPRSKVIHMVNKSFLSFGSPYGKTAVRAAHLAWQMKVFFMKQMGIAGKSNSKPTMIGHAPQKGVKVKVKDRATNQIKEVTPAEALIEMLSHREGNDSLVVGAKTEGYDITVVNNQADLGQYQAVIDQMNVFIFRAFLLPSLILTDGSGGNRALGDKHFEIVDRIAEIDAQKFTETIIYDLIEHCVAENFGEQDDYGSFGKRPVSLEEREKLSNIFGALTMNGYMTPSSQTDMDHVRQSLSLPKGKADLFGDLDDVNGEL